MPLSRRCVSKFYLLSTNCGYYFPKVVTVGKDASENRGMTSWELKIVK